MRVIAEASSESRCLEIVQVGCVMKPKTGVLRVVLLRAASGNRMQHSRLKQPPSVINSAWAARCHHVLAIQASLVCVRRIAFDGGERVCFARLRVVDREAELALVRVIDEGGTSSRTRWSLLKDRYEGRPLEEAAKTLAGSAIGNRDPLVGSPDDSDRNGDVCWGRAGSGEPKLTGAEPEDDEAEAKAKPKEGVKGSCRSEERPGKANTGHRRDAKSFNNEELVVDAGVTGNDILEARRAQGGDHGTAQGKGTVASHAIERPKLVEHSSGPPKQVCGVSEATKTELTMVDEAEAVNVRSPGAPEVLSGCSKVETTLDDGLVDTPPRSQVIRSGTMEEVVASTSDYEKRSEALRQLVPSPPPPTPMALEKRSKRACTVTAPLRSRLPEPPSSTSASPCFDAHSTVVEPPGGDIDGVEIRASSTCRRTVSSGKSEGSNQGIGRNSGGLGVFCSRVVKTGEVVFKEDALMHVCRSQVAPKMWRTVNRVMQEVDRGLRMKKIESLPPISMSGLCKELEGRGSSPPWVGSGVSEMDLLQAIIFDRADSAVQRRVLGLYAPEEGLFPAARRSAWSAALDALRRIGAVGSNAGKERVEDDEWRASLVRVLRICEANIFGQHDDEEVEHGPRSLFYLACRINHSCLPNCSFLVEEGTMTVRAMTDLKPGTELFISYLTFDDALKPTQHRRDVLRAIKYFDCHCCRCSATHDFTRGIRCPRCHRGTVYPPRQEAQRGSPSKYVDRKSAADSGTGDASDAVGASACTACGRVPTRGWLTSAVRVEERVGLELNTCLEDFARLCNEAHTAPIEERRLLDMALIQCSAGLARLYAKALYLLGDHHSMCVLHDYLTEFLIMEGRMEEAAYHSHERLVILLNIMGRPSTSMINEFERLAYCLTTVAGFQKSIQQVPEGYWLPPLAGRCGTYAGLVQISPHVHRSNVGLEKGKRTAAESGYCSVCGRRHGRPCDFVSSGQIDDTQIQGQGQGGMPTPLRVESTSGTPNFANDQKVYLEGSRAALRDALRLSSAVHGHDSTYTVRARCRFLDVERRVNGQRCPPLPSRPEQR